jgi:hypothetical protein
MDWDRLCSALGLGDACFLMESGREAFLSDRAKLLTDYR